MKDQVKATARDLYALAVGVLQMVAVLALLAIIAMSALRLAGVSISFGPRLGIQDVAWCAIAIWALNGGRLS